MNRELADAMSWEETRTGTGPVAKPALSPLPSPRIIGGYALFDQIGAGGMGEVYLGRVVGESDHERVVAIKRAHPSAARDMECVTMFREEIRLHAHVRHPNVVTAVDMVEENGELLSVMEYVHGQALGALMRQGRDFQAPIPLEICAAIACDMLHGLHAAHGARGFNGEPLGIVHRDVSPQNVLIGCDGLAHLVDFGLAKAESSQGQTLTGQVKGKLGYIAPEYMLGERLDARADIYAAAVVFWEMLASQRLFGAKRDAETMQDVLSGNVPRLPQSPARRIPVALEAVVRRGLATDPEQRYGSALDMARAIEEATHRASASALADWVTEAAHTTLVERSRQLAWAENCPLPADARQSREAETLIRLQPYFADELPSEHTVRDAKFDADELRGSFADLRDAATHASDWDDAAIATQVNAVPTFAERVHRPLALAGDTDPRCAQTLPGRRSGGRRMELVRKSALYVAALAAALNMVNRASHDALSERLASALHPERVAKASTAPAPAAVTQSATEPTVPKGPAHAVEAPVVNLTSIPLEGDKASTSTPRPSALVAPFSTPVVHSPMRSVSPGTAPRRHDVQRPDGF